MVYWAQEDNLEILYTAPYLQQQVGGSGRGSGAPGAGVVVRLGGGGVPLARARAQRRGLQDVAAPAVVPETAVVQVHGQAAGLEVERHWEEEHNNNNNNMGIINRGTVWNTTQHNTTQHRHPTTPG